jgi:MFS family permease
MKTDMLKSTAMKFIVLLGIVSLFADITYEGARSIAGQYLAILGASGAVVGFVAGFGEFVGYAFRLVSGYISDKTGKYWLMIFIGYIINLFAVPMLALADNWPMAAALLICERFGKALRNPSRDALLSYATKETGRGFGFGLHEAMDQTGAVLGPLIVSTILYFDGTYQMSFAMLLIPAICALAVLATARMIFPRPQDLEVANPNLKPEGFTKTYWIYIAAVCCIAAGYVDFPLIAYHFEKNGLFTKVWIPIFFAIAMATDGIAALILGRLFDKKGLPVLIFSIALTSLFALFVFANSFYIALAGMILWGIGLGAQESIIRAVVAHLVRHDKRATAYGLLNMGFGTFWFLGSAFMGFLYDISIPALIVFSIAAQLAAIPILCFMQRQHVK